MADRGSKIFYIVIIFLLAYKQMEHTLNYFMSIFEMIVTSSHSFIFQNQWIDMFPIHFSSFFFLFNSLYRFHVCIVLGVHVIVVSGYHRNQLSKIIDVLDVGWAQLLGRGDG